MNDILLRYRIKYWLITHFWRLLPRSFGAVYILWSEYRWSGKGMSPAEIEEHVTNLRGEGK